MLDLLKWRAHPERISDSLSKLREIDGSEIVKVNSSLLLPVDSDDLNYTSALLCPSSFSRTPWTRSLVFWMKALRDMDSKSSIPW